MATNRSSSTSDRVSVDAPRTRGGWIPAGTAADRRANHSAKGTERGRRTRLRLIEAARTVFEDVGYFDAGIDDIVREANVARGSFYTYFKDKLEIFQIVAGGVDTAVLDAVSDKTDVAARGDRVARLHQSNLRYIETYRANSAMYALIEQVSTIDPVVHAGRLRRRRIHVQRIAASIERWQNNGVADPSIDPQTTAGLLASMTANFCYWWFVGQDEYDQDRAATALTDAWVRTLDLRQRPRKSWIAAAQAG